ncbi:hypothetical protein M3J09_001337 [Ascochyta lentis]
MYPFTGCVAYTLTRIALMAIFTLQCEGTVGGPLTNDTVPLPLRDYAVKNTVKTTATPVVSRSSSQSVATLTGVPSTGTASAAVESLSLDTTATTNDNVATVLGDGGSSTMHTADTASSSSSTSQSDTPVLSTATIAGIAVGGTVLLALIVCVVFFFLRRHKRKKSANSISPPAYEPTDEKHEYVKPELDGQALEHHYSDLDVAAPVEYAELDTGSPVIPAGETGQLSGHDGRARTAQNF